MNFMARIVPSRMSNKLPLLVAVMMCLTLAAVWTPPVPWRSQVSIGVHDDLRLIANATAERASIVGVWKPRDSKPKISSTGAWILPPDFQYYLDASLAHDLCWLFEGRSVLEFGAGMGRYTEYIRDSCKATRVSAFDGVKDIERRSGGIVKHADLTVPNVVRGNMYDWVLCLEVLEHIPNVYESTAIENLVHNSRFGMVISWAAKGQGGKGHVNEQNKEYVVETLGKFGFLHSALAGEILRQRATLPWFHNTIYVFTRAT